MDENKPLTWRELSTYGVDPDIADFPIYICVDGEFFPCVILEHEENPLVDDGHPYLEVIKPEDASP